MNRTPVIIMAGGYGTRLKPFSLRLPKPMLPFANRPILEHTVRLLRCCGFTSATALLLYKPEKITGYFKDGSQYGVKIQYHTAQQDLGTAGAVRTQSEHLNSAFVVVSGDVITDVDLAELLKFHRRQGGIATIMLARVTNPLPFGLTIINDNFRIKQFIEKPAQSELISDLVNAGIYVFEPEIFRYIPVDQPFWFARDLYPLLLKQGVPIYGFVHPGYWQDIGDLHQYLLSHHDFLDGKFDLPEIILHANVMNSGERLFLGKNVQFERTVVIGKDCSLGEGARIVRSAIGDNVTLGAGVEIVDSVVWSNVKIGAGSRLISGVIAGGTVIEENVYFDDHVFVAEDCKIGDLSILKTGVKIWPGKKIESGTTITSSLVWGDRWLRELFTGAQVTGIINQEISPEFAAKLGAAFGSFLGKGGAVLTSWDGTPPARMINRAIICGLLSTGMNVGDLRVMPIPIMRYALRTGAAKGGVHVRQSPQQDNSIEILILEADGQDLSAYRAKSVERLFMQEDFARADFSDIGQLDFPVRVVESYQDQYLKNLAIPEIEKAKFKIVVDYSFGPASLILPSVLGSLDCEVVALNAYLDTKRILRRWVDFRYALLQLANIVVSLKADAGFLIDASTERIFVVDEAGNFLQNEYLLTLITKLYLATYQPVAIGMPVSAPLAIYRLASQYGAEVVPIRFDFRAIIDVVRQHQIAFAGDSDGRFIFPDFQFASDGMFAMGKILSLLAMNNLRLGELRQTISPPVIDKKQVPFSLDHIGRVLHELADSDKDNVESTFDGIKFHFADGWVLISSAAQEPAIAMIAEGETRERVNQILEQFSRRLETLQKNLQQK